MKKDAYVIVVDNLTKYWDVEELTDTSDENTILQTKKIFSRHGAPEFVISDKGPQYTSGEYRRFYKNGISNAILHHHIIHGTAEAAVKQAKRIVKLNDDTWLPRASKHPR